jgi:nicotinamide-nucleotide amidase
MNTARRQPSKRPRTQRASAAASATPPRLGRILSIGDELVLGRCVDTNAAHIARWMTDHGLRVDGVSQVGDAQHEIVAALARVSQGASLVVVSGGLGPTEDDRTRHALAAAMGVELVHDEASWRDIQAYFTRAGVTRVPEVNRRQALLPRSAAIITNREGTAPGILARLGEAYVVCTPGVPHEMVAMLGQVSQRLPRLLPGLTPPVISELWCSGLGESTAQELIPGLLTERHPMVGITVSEAGHLTLRVVGTSTEVARRTRALTRALKRYLLPQAGLAMSLVAELARRRMTIATAESCTCGQVMAALGAVSGVSRVLQEGLLTYSESAKRRHLGVPPDLIAEHGVVSEAVALAMASGMRTCSQSQADLCVATTGVAGPLGGTSANPVGTVWVAVADAQGAVARRHHIRGDRARVQRRGAAYALQLAWERLQGSQARR